MYVLQEIGISTGHSRVVDVFMSAVGLFARISVGSFLGWGLRFCAFCEKTNGRVFCSCLEGYQQC
jgi:hypothetical protein